MQREHWEYGIFNDITEDEARKLPEVDRWYLKQIGPSYLNSLEAIDEASEFNFFRSEAREAAQSDIALEVDRLVGRAVNVKVMRQKTVRHDWEPLH
jgi:hypothetical protein